MDSCVIKPAPLLALQPGCLHKPSYNWYQPLRASARKPSYYWYQPMRASARKPSYYWYQPLRASARKSSYYWYQPMRASARKPRSNWYQPLRASARKPSYYWYQPMRASPHNACIRSCIRSEMPPEYRAKWPQNFVPSSYLARHTTYPNPFQRLKRPWKSTGLEGVSCVGRIRIHENSPSPMPWLSGFGKYPFGVQEEKNSVTPDTNLHRETTTVEAPKLPLVY
jgi:hypothetical protein